MTGYKSKLAAAQDKLAQPAQDSNWAWMYPDALCDRACLYVCTKAFTQFPECATTPPQRTWVELEGEEIRNLWEEATKPDRSTVTIVTSFARAIEAKLKEKNT